MISAVGEGGLEDGAGGSVEREELLSFGLAGRHGREVAFWVLNALFWVLIGVCGMLTVDALRSGLDDPRGLVVWRCVLGFVYSLGLRKVYQMRLFAPHSSFTSWLLALALCFLVASVEAMVSLAVPNVIASDRHEALRLLFTRWFFLSFWTLVYFSLHVVEDHWRMRLRALGAEKARLQSELKRLKAQVNPHFLFNALNAVVACKDDARAVEDVTHSLADYLRFSLENARDLEPLRRELDSLEKYLHVQSARFGGNLRCSIDCELAAGGLWVPPMMVQPLLENAFNHGGKGMAGPMEVRIRAERHGGRLHVRVANTGTWVAPGSSGTPGTGLRTLRQRLGLVFGPEVELSVSSADGWVEVLIDVPAVEPGDGTKDPPIQAEVPR